MKKPLFCLLLLGICLGKSFGQEITAKISGITEIRSYKAKDASLNLYLEFEGGEWNEFSHARFRGGYVVDNLNHRLNLLNPFKLQNISSIEVKFELPLRAASHLKKAVIQMEISTPTIANGAIVHFPNFYEKKDRNIFTDHPKYGDLNLTIVDSIQSEQDVVRIMGKEKLPHLRGGSFQPKTPDSLYSTYILFEDPKDRLLSINILDADGLPVQYLLGDRYNYGNMILQRKFYFYTPIQENWTLELVLENKQALQEYTFEFYDIELH